MNDPRCFDAHRGVEGGLTLFQLVQNKAVDRAQFDEVSTYFNNHNAAYEARWQTAVTNAPANVNVAALRRRGGALIEMCSANHLIRAGELDTCMTATRARGKESLTAIAMLPIPYDSLITPNAPLIQHVFSVRTVNIVLALKLFLEHQQKAATAAVPEGGVKLKKEVLVEPRMRFG
jgi:hypothetical protein